MEEEKISRAARYYRLHREERLAKRKMEYANNPDVIAKREEKERKKAEKEQELAAKKENDKAQKALEKQRKIEKMIAVALATSQRKKKVEEPISETPPTPPA